jgi:GntR family transcriptional regulator/MocR family aminotransferase
MPSSGKQKKKGGSGRKAMRTPRYFVLGDEDLSLAIHERLYRRMRHLILTGSLEDGARIAPSRELASSLRVSRNSVLAAFDRLIADGFLESRRSSGVFVSYASSRPKPVAAVNQTPQPQDTPFDLGWATDIFPLEKWKKLQARNWRTMPDTLLTQSNRLGLTSLRTAIATYLAATRRLECAAEQVIVTTSIPAGVELAVRALKLSGAQCWVEDPCCRSPLAALQQSGVATLPVAVDASGIDVAAGIRQWPQARAALISATCQAPTGAALSPSRQTALCRWAQANGAWIFEDDFNWNGDGVARTAKPFASVCPQRTLYLNSFNNILFSGLRIAYIVVPAELVDRFESVRGTEGDVNTPNQLVLTDFIESGYLDDHARRLDAANMERRAALLEATRNELHDHFKPLDNGGGYFIARARRMDEAEAVQRAAGAGIVITALSSYRAQPGGHNEVMLGFSQFAPQKIAQAARKLRLAFDSKR